MCPLESSLPIPLVGVTTPLTSVVIHSLLYFEFISIKHYGLAFLSFQFV